MSTNGSAQIERFLLDDMTDEERETFEERLLADDELFYLVAEAEDDLADRYVRGRCTKEEADQFEEILVRHPDWQRKVLNAKAFRKVIREEKSSVETITIAERAGFWERLFSAHFFGSQGVGFATAGLFFLLTGAIGWLIYQNIEANAEIARLNELYSNGANLEQLEQELVTLRTRETELQSEIDAQRDVGGDLTADLESERSRRADLEREIASLRAQRPDLPKPSPRKTVRPNVGAITLNPGGDDQIASNDTLQSVKRISVVIQLPADIDPSERLTVKLNGNDLARDLAVRVGSNGSKSVSVALLSSQLRSGSNQLTIHNSVDKQIAIYLISDSKEDE